jgi:hypothetical protein
LLRSDLSHQSVQLLLSDLSLRSGRLHLSVPLHLSDLSLRSGLSRRSDLSRQ